MLVCFKVPLYLTLLSYRSGVFGFLLLFFRCLLRLVYWIQWLVHWELRLGSFYYININGRPYKNKFQYHTYSQIIIIILRFLGHASLLRVRMAEKFLGSALIQFLFIAGSYL